MYKPLGKRVVIKVDRRDEQKTKHGIVMIDQVKQRQKRPTATGIIVATNNKNDFKVNDEVIYREATYSKNGTAVNPDKVDDEHIIINESDIIAVVG